MAYGLGGDSGYTKGIAFSMGWGLLVATVATLGLIPVAVEIREDIMNIFRRILRYARFVFSSSASESVAESSGHGIQPPAKPSDVVR